MPIIAIEYPGSRADSRASARGPSAVDLTALVRRAGGEQAFTRIRWEPDSLIQRIVSGWPRALDACHVEALGFTAGTGIDEVVKAFIEHDLEMQKRFA